MSVYVDEFRAKVGRMQLSHMIADTTDELLAMVDRIGVDRKWIQAAGTPEEHFDIALSKRRLAIEAGAIPVTTREIARLRSAKRTGVVSASLPSEREGQRE